MTSPIIQKNSLNETGYKSYITYLAIKRHFTSSYDYHKYNGKINASYDSFISRKDAYFFQRLGKERDVEGLILSNIIVNPKIWAGNLLDDSARQTYMQWKKKQDAITQHVKESLSELEDDFRENFYVKKGAYPHIVDLYLQKKISLEALTILTKVTKSDQYWKGKVIDKVVFPDILKKVNKYHPFINYSNEKMTKAIKDHFF